jgi:arginase family enzyme
VKTAVIIFPFDLFGGSGTAAGAQLLADELREILADNRREHVPTRAVAYTGHVKLREFTFETLKAYQSWRTDGRRAAREALDRGDFLLWISGNHLSVLPLYDELGTEHSRNLVVQLDAHLDIHHFADCTKELSHGNFLRHTAGPLPQLVNVGHRELLLRADDVREFYTATYGADALAVDPEPALQYLRDASRSAERVFLDIDCDAFDPSFFPAVSQPVPFGLSPSFLLRLLHAVWSPRVAGMMISEFDPARDRNDQSLATLIWLLEWVLLKRYENLV